MKIRSLVWGSWLLLAISTPACVNAKPLRKTNNPPAKETPLVGKELEKTQETLSLSKQIHQAREALDKVKDYSCSFTKRERVQGKLLPEQMAQMTVRCEPFSVYMRFTSPMNVAGQEVCYVHGKNNNQLRVKGSGLKSAIGFVTLPMNDPRVMAQSRHTMAEAGIANLLNLIAQSHDEDKGKNCRIESSRMAFDDRKCCRYDICPTEESKAYFHRCIIYFDEETKLPIRFEAYGRPQGDEKLGELLECYTYSHLKLNVNPPEDLFKK